MNRFTIFMASILAMAGCAKNADFDNTPTRNRVQMTISAGNEAETAVDDTRIEFNGSIYDMRWQADDLIGVYIAGTGEKADFTAYQIGDDGKSARFEAEIYEPEPIDSYYAFYPATTPFSGSIASFVLPNKTSGASEPLLVAKHQNTAMSDVSLSFHPITAVLELTLGFDADNVIIESNNGESLAGVCAYNFASDTMQEPIGSTSITLTSPAKGTHYLYIPAVTLSKGYKVIVEKDGAQMIKSVAYNSGKSFTAGSVTPLTISTFEAVSVSLCDVYTTYTLAQRKNSEANNTANTNTIFFAGDCSYAGISNTLVKECGVVYGDTTVKATPSNKKFSISNQLNKPQGSYEVYAYIKTVDDTIYKSATQTVYITGLPYSIEFAASTSQPSWTISNSKVMSLLGNYFALNNGEAYMLSPRFTLPASTSVKASFQMYSYASNVLWAGFDVDAYLSASESDVKSNLVRSLGAQIAYPGTADFREVATTVSLTPTVGKVCLHTTGSTRGAVVTWGVIVKSCFIGYNL